MVNIDRTIILSYPRTGSTAFLDIHEQYLSGKAVNYTPVPCEVFTPDTWRFHEDQHKRINYYHPFFDKHNLRSKINKFIEEFKPWRHFDPELPREMFECVLKEDFFVTKIFPHHILDNEEYMSRRLLELSNDGYNVIALYRRNLLDSLSSLLSCLSTNIWVSSKIGRPRLEEQVVVKAKDVCLEEAYSSTVGSPVWYFLRGVVAWHECYQTIKSNGGDIKLVAYEDIENFDETMLENLYGVQTDFPVTSLTRVQHHHDLQSHHEQIKVLHKYRELIEDVITSELRQRIPINALNHMVIPE